MSFMSRFSAFLKPHKTVPVTSWRAKSRWDLSFSRVLILFFGLAIFGLGDALVVQSNLGNAPWTVFAQGLSLKTGLSLGWATFVTGCFVLLIWIPLRERPGFGTLSNIVIISAAIEFGVSIFPLQQTLIGGVVSALIGIALVGLGSALYITCGLGPGPRDGIHQRTGVRVGRVRMGIEITVLIVGALLGGQVGLGTALFALLIGQSVAISFGIVARLTSK
jgi:uncharacterized membrane protein YczE